MTSDEQQEFIRLWNTGTETAAIAQALGIPVGIATSPCPGHGRATVQADGLNLTEHRLAQIGFK